jgi:RHS repeat-associated protein
MSYDAFGNRRDAATWDWGKIPSIVDIVKLSTRLGFTGHIQLDEVGLIHMKGRIYDPWIGRFISPDPTVKYPYNSQSLNRYSYCLNNPLRYIDPSGFTEESTSGGTTAPDSITSTDGMGGESSGPSFGDMGGVPETKSTDPTDVGQDSSDKMKGLGEDSTPQNKKKDQKKDRSAGEDGQVNNQDIGGKGTGKEINLGLENRLPEVEKDVTLGDIIKSPFVGNPPLPNGEPEVRYHGDSAEDCAKAAVDTIIEKGKPIVIDKAKEAIKPATDAIKEKGKEVYNNNKALSIVSGVVMGTAYLCYKYSQDESVSVSGSISAGGWDIGISGNTDFKSSHGFSVSFSHGF